MMLGTTRQLWLALPIAALSIAPHVWAQGPASTLRAAGFEPTANGARAVLRTAHPLGADRQIQIDWWIEKLDDPLIIVRERAAARLRGVGASGAAALEHAANAGSVEVRNSASELAELIRREHEPLFFAALDILIQTAAAEVIDDVLRSAPSVSRPMQNRMGRTLAKLAHAQDIPRLLLALREEHPALRRIAVRVLSEVLPLARTEECAFASQDADPDVRLRIAEIRTRAGQVGACVDLLDLMEDRYPARVRARANAILRGISGQQFGFLPFAKPSDRASAIAMWRGWHSRESGRFKPILPLRVGDDALDVTGFWVSTSAGLTFFDRDLKQRRHIPCEPYDVEVQRDGHLLAALRGTNSVAMFDPEGQQVLLATELQSPCDADRLPDGNILIVEGGTNTISEVTPGGKPVWKVGGLSSPFDAQRLPDGNTLVADSGNNRIVEFRPDGEIAATIENVNFPNGIYRTEDGQTIATNYTSGEVLLFDEDDELVWQTKVGGTVYSPCLAAGTIWVADGSAGQLIMLNMQGRILGTLKLSVSSLNDVSYAR